MNIEFKKLEWEETTDKKLVSYKCVNEIKLRDFGFENLQLWYSIFLLLDNHFYVAGNAMMIKYKNGGFPNIPFKTLEEAKEFVQEYHNNICKEMINRILS